MPITNDADLKSLLETVKRIAVVGASPNPARPSYGVTRFLIEQGYEVIPVNPGHAGEEIFGTRFVGSLAEIAPPVDMVDIFRNSAAAGDAIDAAIGHGAKAVWLQLGVVNRAAAERAEAAGLKVVMDRCPKIDIPRLGLMR